MSPDPYWKQGEREMRKALHLERDVHLGEEGADGRNEWLVVELKCRKKLPAWIIAAVMQAIERSTPSQLPIAILHEKGTRHSIDLVVMVREDFETWFGKGDAAQAQPEPNTGAPGVL